MHIPVRAPRPGRADQVRRFAAPRFCVATASLLLCPLWLTACPQAEAETDGTTTIDSTAGDSTASASTSPTEAPTSAAETMPAASCPDGDVGEGEDCDDGNDINGDGCNNDCRPSAVQLWDYHSDERGSSVRVSSIAVDADASIVVGGQNSGLTAWVARFSPELAPLWSQKYADGAPGLVRGVALGDGVIYAAGAHFSDADGHDIWVARLDPEGTIEWEDKFSGGAGDDWLTQAAVVDGDVVVTGLALGDQIWTRRYGGDGAVQWTATFPLGNTYKNIYPLGPGLAATPDAIMVGWSAYKAMNLFPELLIAYPHGGGEPSWTAELPATQGGINAIAADPGGDLVLAVNADFAALTVRRATGTGEVLWSSADCSGDGARDVAIDGQGDIVVIGDGPGGNGRNIRLCKFAADGTLRWGKDIDGGFGDDLGYAVAIDPSDRVIAGGNMRNDQGGRDAWLAVFSP